MSARFRKVSGVLVLVAIAALVFACTPPDSEAPHAVVLMIGDGLGPSQITFARHFLLEEGERFAFEEMPITALMSTHSASNAVTDSGAAATAMAAGVKTDNRYVGMNAAAERVRSITELAQAKGWRVGYVTTTAVTHATPAAFYSHVPNRYADEEEIAVQLLGHRPDVVLGGGFSAFLPVDDGGQRRDDRNLLDEAESAGFTVWRRGQDLSAEPPEQLLGLFSNGHLFYKIDDRRYPEERRDPSLESLTRLALEALGQGGKPFFLMVEGGRIDQACHSFDAVGAAWETADYDGAVRAVLDYQREHPRTLVISTADHATGGLAINDYVDWPALERQKASVDWMAAQIRGTEAGTEMLAEMTGFDDFTDEEVEAVRTAIDSYTAGRILGRALGERNGVTWIPRLGPPDTYGHTGEDVPLYAGGPGAERFQGTLDNTDVPRRIAELLGWEAPN